MGEAVEFREPVNRRKGDAGFRSRTDEMAFEIGILGHVDGVVAAVVEDDHLGLESMMGRSLEFVHVQVQPPSPTRVKAGRPGAATAAPTTEGKP